MTRDLLSTHLSSSNDENAATSQQTDKKTIVRKPVRITETLLRDGHQSLLATRMRTKDMLPILEKMDQVGYWSIEMWGGATYDSCLRFLREDPWERLRLLRKGLPNTRLQMLIRGQNIVGYKHYPDDLVDHFIEHAAHNGIDVFRIFDALNDVRNMKRAIEAVKKMGKIAEGAISYTISPFHTVDRYVELGLKLEEMGCDILAIKDMAGLLTPYTTYELVSKLKEKISIPIHIHSHSTSGMSETAYLKGVEAGADILDGAISSMAGGTSQPPTESLVAMFQGTPYDTGLNLGLLAEIAEYVREIRKKYSRFESPFNGVDPQVLQFQIPGGMISNLANQLREQDALDRMEEVLEEVPKVRADMGFPPLVTPTSQIVGTQATLNVLMGERYKVLSVESRNLLLGKYGKTPASCNPELLKKAEELSKESFIEQRPADLLEPQWEACLEAVKDEEGNLEENALSYAMFPQVARDFFAIRRQKGPLPTNVAAAISAVIHHLKEKNSKEQNGAQTSQQCRQMNPWKWAGRLQGLRHF